MEDGGGGGKIMKVALALSLYLCGPARLVCALRWPSPTQTLHPIHLNALKGGWIEVAGMEDGGG
eukprot:5682563-Amphidinium_carterae.1